VPAVAARISVENVAKRSRLGALVKDARGHAKYKWVLEMSSAMCYTHPTPQ